MTDAQRKEFEEITRPVIKWLCENSHPHAAIVIEPTQAVLYEATIGYPTQEYLKD